MMEADKRKKLIDKLKKNKYILALVLVGTVLILWPTGSSSGTGQASNDSSLESPTFSLEETEEKLAELLSQIDGAGEVKVMLSLEKSTARVVAQDTSDSSTQSDEDGSQTTEMQNSVTTVILSKDSGDDALTLVYIYPEYLGAVVIAQGAGNASVKLQLTEAVAAATGLGTDRISVIKMKGS